MSRKTAIRIAFVTATVVAAMPLHAGGPRCVVEETCTETSDNCQPAEGILRVTALDAYKATVQLDNGPVFESTYLGLNGVLALIFSPEPQHEHQLRIQDNGTFNYLVSTPNADAHNGKDQILYRGTCVEN